MTGLYEGLYMILLPTVEKIEALRKVREKHLENQEMKEVFRINQTFLEWNFEATQAVLTYLNSAIASGSGQERETARILKNEFFDTFHPLFNESSPAFLRSWITGLKTDFEGNGNLDLETA